MAIASYERTLVADQTPWDIAQREGSRLPGRQNLGWEFFQTVGCDQCHAPPLFTDNKFHNIGLRGLADDPGRMGVTDSKEDNGDMKTPSLRNAALKKTFMHTGEYRSLAEVVDIYADVPVPSAADEMPEGGVYDINLNELQRSSLIDFLQNSLTDPRVAAGHYPFDRPTLRSEADEAVRARVPGKPFELTALETEDGTVVLEWRADSDAPTAMDYLIVRNDELHVWTSNMRWEDRRPPNGDIDYSVFARGADFSMSESALARIERPVSVVVYLSVAVLVLLSVLAIAFGKKFLKRRVTDVRRGIRSAQDLP